MSVSADDEDEPEEGETEEPPSPTMIKIGEWNEIKKKYIQKMLVSEISVKKFIKGREMQHFCIQHLNKISLQRTVPYILTSLE